MDEYDGKIIWETKKTTWFLDERLQLVYNTIQKYQLGRIVQRMENILCHGCTEIPNHKTHVKYDSQYSDDFHGHWENHNHDVQKATNSIHYQDWK